MQNHHTALSRARLMLEQQGRFPGGALSSQISDSWLRSLGHGLDPLARHEDMVLGSADFHSARQRHADLIHFARPELELLYDQVAGSHFMIALGSPEGVVLETLSDGQFAESDAGRAVIPGSVWTEGLRGTNALGLCITTRTPVQIYGGEHFLRAHGDVSCISAPIFDGRGGLAGVLDASSGSTIRQQHTAALVQMSASNIENSLIRAAHDRRIVLQFHPRPEYLGTLSVGMLVLDEGLAVHAVNRRGEAFLTGFPTLLGEAFDGIFDQRFDDVAQRLLQGETLRLRDRMGSGLSVRCVANRASFALAGRMMPTMTVDRVAAAAPALNPFRDVVLDDPAMLRMLSGLPAAAKAGKPICLVGEPGTGKETFARLAHTLARKDQPFVAVDGATLTGDDAMQAFVGRVEGQGILASAEGGSLYVTDLAVLPSPLQTVLVRVLERRGYNHPATGAFVQVDVHLMASATVLPRAGALVALLQYCLMAGCFNLPPLRDRTDVIALAERIAVASRAGATLSAEAAHLLATHDWPGNLHELRAVVQEAALRRTRGAIMAEDLTGLLPDRPADATFAPCSLCATVPWKADQCRTIQTIVQRNGGNVSKAAFEMGMSRTTVYKHLSATTALH